MSAGFNGNNTNQGFNGNNGNTEGGGAGWGQQW